MLIERNLVWVRRRDGKKFQIKVGVGLPYRPARLAGFEDMAACVVHTGLDDAGEREVFGIDELQALGAALSSVDAFLKVMIAQGEFFWGDGRQYTPPKDSIFAIDIRNIVEGILKNSLTE